MKEQIRPMWATTVDPSEYDVDGQLTDWLKAANKEKECFFGIDVGKMWGLYLSWKKQQEHIAELETALKRYGWHDGNCPRYPTWAEWILKEGRIKPCDCGYDKTLKGDN